MGAVVPMPALPEAARSMFPAPATWRGPPGLEVPTPTFPAAYMLLENTVDQRLASEPRLETRVVWGTTLPELESWLPAMSMPVTTTTWLVQTLFQRATEEPRSLAPSTEGTTAPGMLRSPAAVKVALVTPAPTESEPLTSSVVAGLEVPTPTLPSTMRPLAGAAETPA